MTSRRWTRSRPFTAFGAVLDWHNVIVQAEDDQGGRSVAIPAR